MTQASRTVIAMGRFSSNWRALPSRLENTMTFMHSSSSPQKNGAKYTRAALSEATSRAMLLPERWTEENESFVLYILVTPLSWLLPATLRPVALRPRLSAGLPFTVWPNMQNRLTKDQAVAAHILEHSVDV